VRVIYHGRLDPPTSGLVLLCLQLLVARMVTSGIETLLRLCAKTYLVALQRGFNLDIGDLATNHEAPF